MEVLPRPSSITYVLSSKKLVLEQEILLAMRPTCLRQKNVKKKECEKERMLKRKNVKKKVFVSSLFFFFFTSSLKRLRLGLLINLPKLTLLT